MSYTHFRYFIYLCNAVTCSRHIKRKCFRKSLKENVVVFIQRSYHNLLSDKRNGPHTFFYAEVYVAQAFGSSKL